MTQHLERAPGAARFHAPGFGRTEGLVRERGVQEQRGARYDMGIGIGIVLTVIGLGIAAKNSADSLKGKESAISGVQFAFSFCFVAAGVAMLAIPAWGVVLGGLAAAASAALTLGVALLAAWLASRR